MPDRLRGIGQTELIASTGVREPAVARIAAGELIAQWRRRFLELDRLQVGMGIDVLRETAGSPILALGEGHIPLLVRGVARNSDRKKDLPDLDAVQDLAARLGEQHGPTRHREQACIRGGAAADHHDRRLC